MCVGVRVHTERNFMGRELSCQSMYTKYITSITGPKLFVLSGANGDDSLLPTPTLKSLLSFQSSQNFSQPVDLRVNPSLRAWVRQERIRCTLPTPDTRREKRGSQDKVQGRNKDLRI